MEIQADQGLLILNLDNVQALQQMNKGDCIYTLAVGNSDNYGTTMVQIPVSLECNRNNISFQHSYIDNPNPQQTAIIQQYNQQLFDQVHMPEQFQCLLQSSDGTSLTEMKSPFLQDTEDTILTIVPEPVPIEHTTQTSEELPAPDNADQDQEVDHQAIYNYIESNVVPRFASEKYIKTLKKRSRNYSIINKVLYHGVAKLRKVVVDKEVQEKLLKDSHILKDSGVHLGVNKMYMAITASYFWKEVYLDVTNYVRQCKDCSERIIEGTIDQPEGTPSHSDNVDATTSDNNVWKSVEAQMHGPFSKTCQGNEYILTISDPISHWIVAQPITKEELPVRMANFIFETFCVFGFAKCQVVSSCTKNFAVIQDVYQEASGAVKVACGGLNRTEGRLCAWAEDLIGGLVAEHPVTWDRELPAFLFRYRVAAGDNGSPFAKMLRRSGKICGSEKENHELTDERELPEGTRNRRRLQSSILQCRHCEESFTSKISFRIHQRKHVVDARRRGILEGQETSCMFFDSETKLLRTGSSKKNKSLKRSGNLTKFVTHRLDQLRSSRNNELRANRQTLKSKIDRDELKANTLAAVRDMLAQTKDTCRKRGRYHKFPLEIQEEMARYAVKHGNMSAVNHFSAKLGCAVSESTVRNIVSADRKFPPEMKEEIGRYATAFGVNAGSSFYSKSLGVTVRRSLVRKLQNEYVRRYPEAASHAEAVLEHSAGAQNEMFPTVAKGSAKSGSKRRHHTIFTPEIREEIGRYAAQFSVSDTIQHFSSRFLLKKSTVINYRKIHLSKTQPIESNDIVQESSVVPSTSQTINIMNASLSLLNNPHMSNSTTTAICSNLYQPLPADETRQLIYTSGPSMESHSTQTNPNGCNQHAVLFNHGHNSVNMTLQSAQNDFVSFNSVQQEAQNSKADSLYELSAATPFSENVLFRDAQSHPMNPLTFVVSSSSTLNSPHTTYTSLSPTSTLFVLPTQQLTHIPQDQQEYHQLVDTNDTNQISFDHARRINDGFMPVYDGKDGQSNDIAEFNPVVQEINLPSTNEPEFSEAANASTSPPQDCLRQIIPRAAKKNKTIFAKKQKSKTVASESEVEDDPDSESDSSLDAKKKRVKSFPRRKKSEKKEVIEKRGAYTMYSPEIRARIGKYAVEHGNQRACTHFEALLGHVIPESTVRGLRDKYLLKREQLSSVKNVTAEVNSLGYFPRGRPTRLGKYDEIVQECVWELMKSGVKVSTALVIATARQVLAQNEPSLLEENGGTTILNVTWAKSFLRRIGIRNNC